MLRADTPGQSTSVSVSPTDFTNNVMKRIPESIDDSYLNVPKLHDTHTIFNETTVDPSASLGQLQLLNNVPQNMNAVASSMPYPRLNQTPKMRSSPYNIPVIDRRNSEGQLSTLAAKQYYQSGSTASSSSGLNTGIATSLASATTTPKNQSYEFALEHGLSPAGDNGSTSTLGGHCNAIEDNIKNSKLFTIPQQHQSHEQQQHHGHDLQHHQEQISSHERSDSEVHMGGNSPQNFTPYLDTIMGNKRKDTSFSGIRGTSHYLARYEIERRLDIELFKAKEEIKLRQYEVEERIKIERDLSVLKKQKLQAELDKTKAESERIQLDVNIAAVDLEAKQMRLNSLKRQYEAAKQPSLKES